MPARKPETYANLFYFRVLQELGGTEQFLYEIAKKYHSRDITVLYDSAPVGQIVRISKFVRMIKRDPSKIYRAERAFFNFNIDAIDQIEADEYIFVCHAIYSEIGYKPPITHPKINRIIAVSKFAQERMAEDCLCRRPGIAPEVCYNPLSLEKPQKILRIVTAARLDDRTKGAWRAARLAQALDEYSERTGRPYDWLIFSKKPCVAIKSPNVRVMEPRLNVRDYIAEADWLVNLSNDMETYCYALNEALCYGARVVRTPLSVAEELKIPPQAELVVGWNCEGVEKVAELMFEPAEPFKYTPPKDGWAELLVNCKSTYSPEKRPEMVEVQPVADYYDLKLKRRVGAWAEPFRVSFERAVYLAKRGLVVFC